MSSSIQVYIGVDPGQVGGIASICVGTRLQIVEAVPMPATELDVWMVLENVDWKDAQGCKAIIEKVHSFPGQGVSSTFKFGVGYGGLRMALTASRIPFEAISPNRWQRGLGIRPKKKSETTARWKNHLRGIAQQLFPKVDVTLKTADALLIAEYCRRKDRGLL